MPAVPRACAIAAALVLSGVAAAEQGAPRAAAGTPGAPAAEERIVRLRFAWPAPLRARVTYRKTRVSPAGRTAFTARYETRVEAEEDGLRITARGTSWRGDLPFRRPLAKQAIRASEAVVQRVGRDGEFRELVGVEAMRPVLARVLEDAKVPPEAAERALALALGAMRAEAEEAWNLAVGFWTGADLALGQTYALESASEIPLLPGVRAPQAVEFGVRRRVPCAAGERAPRCVEATIRSTPDPAALRRASDALLARLVPADEERPGEAASRLSAQSELVLVTDPGTLLPHRMVWTKAVRLGGEEDGKARAELADRSEWDWRYLAPAPPPRRKGERQRAAPVARSGGSAGAT